MGGGGARGREMRTGEWKKEKRGEERGDRRGNGEEDCTRQITDDIAGSYC